MPAFDVFGFGAPLAAAGTVGVGIFFWLGSVLLRALVGGRRRASPLASGCGCLLGLATFAVVAAVPLLFALYALGTAGAP